MFPAPAGMSPRDHLPPHAGGNVPRTCGDEPAETAKDFAADACSPHLRDEPVASRTKIAIPICSPHLRG